MTLPLWVLAAGSAVVGLLGIPVVFAHLFGSDAHINMFENWLTPVISKVSTEEAAHGSIGLELGLMVLSLAVAVGGIWLGRLFYEKRAELAAAWTEKLGPLYKLSFNKWYWDYLLDVKGVEAGKAVNDALWKVDAKVVDGGVNGSGWLTQFSAKVSGWWDKWVIDLAVNATGWITRAGSIIFRSFQTGLWQNYALLFALGLFFIVVIYVYPAVQATIKGFLGD